jgi:hypothetical protein
MKTPITLSQLPSPPSLEAASEDSYPGTWLRFPVNDDPELPTEGEITFRYCVRRKSIETQGDKGTVEYSVDLKEIVDAREDDRPSKLKTAEEALKELMKS